MMYCCPEKQAMLLNLCQNFMTSLVVTLWQQTFWPHRELESERVKQFSTYIYCLLQINYFKEILKSTIAIFSQNNEREFISVKKILMKNEINICPIPTKVLPNTNLNPKIFYPLSDAHVLISSFVYLCNVVVIMQNSTHILTTTLKMSIW